MNDPVCIRCGDPLTEDEKKLEFENGDGMCESCRQKAEYQSQIPIFCQLQTTQEHMDMLMLCWSITNGLIRDRGVEGPQRCHTCDVSIRAKRWQQVWYRRFQNGTLENF